MPDPAPEPVEVPAADLAAADLAWLRAWSSDPRKLYPDGRGAVNFVAALLVDYDRLKAENKELRAHILDIDAHATPYGDIPDDPGWVGTYLLTAGALHRALGKIGHTAPSCSAEADLARALPVVEAAKAVVDAYSGSDLDDNSDHPLWNRLDDLARELDAGLYGPSPTSGGDNG